METLDKSSSIPSVTPWLVSAVFLLALLTPGVSGLFGYDVTPGLTENRTLAEFPWREARSLQFRQFSRKFDSFINDHFGFRTLLIYWLAHVKYALHTSAYDRVIMGKDGWLFQDSAEPRGMTVLPAPLVQRWHDTFAERANWITKNGSRFLMAIPPEKEMIYPEYLPDWLRRQGQLTLISQFLSVMRHSNVDVLDLTPALDQAKLGGRPLFYKNDTHWNQLGAFYGALSIVNHLHSVDPRVPVAERADYETPGFRTRRKPDASWLDLGTMLLLDPPAEEDFAVVRKGGWTTKETVRHVGAVDIFTYTKNAPDLPTILVYADSFGFDLHRVIAEYFRKAVFVNWWPQKANLAETFPLDLIKQEHPDIFVYIRWEAGLFGALEPFSASKQSSSDAAR